MVKMQDNDPDKSSSKSNHNNEEDEEPSIYCRDIDLRSHMFQETPRTATRLQNNGYEVEEED